MTNAQVVQKLREHASALGHSGANLYRVRAFRQAAFILSATDKDLKKIVMERGQTELQKEFGIGASIAETVAEYLRSGD